MSALDLTAKLLATENISVIRAATATAYFDVNTRVLALPSWKDMTPVIESMLISHEVGHALYTDRDEWMAAISNVSSALKGYINVIEDARIEKLMKRRYPGIRKTFFKGYSELMQRDFFKLAGAKLNTLLLIDRVNLYFKVGCMTDVVFTDTEQLVIDRISKVETFAEVVAIATEMFKAAKTPAKSKPEAAQPASSTEDEEATESVTGEEAQPEDADSDEDSSDSDDSDDSSESDDTPNSATDKDNSDEPEGTKDNESQVDDSVEKSNDEDSKSEDDESAPNSSSVSTTSSSEADTEFTEEEAKSITDEALSSALENRADTKSEHRYYEFVHSSDNVIIPFKQVLAETVQLLQSIRPDEEEQFDKFMSNSSKVVNYLVKEFEMKKSAAAYSRTTISKSGSLNVNKLANYKLTDDIFKRISITPNGKNHGMMFLLDWSGSMVPYIKETVEQVINLTMFCRKINIPFEVYAFSGSYVNECSESEKLKIRDLRNELHSINCNAIYADPTLRLLNLFSSKMTNSEFKTAAKLFTAPPRIMYNTRYELTSTPLNDALVKMLDIIPAFRKSNNIDKLTFITLTDGAGDRLQTNRNILRYKGYGAAAATIENTIVDKMTGRHYKLSSNEIAQTTMLLNMIKDRYGVALLGFNITGTAKNRVAEAYRNNVVDPTNIASRWVSSDIIAEIQKNLRTNKFHSIFNSGHDELFIIASSSTAIEDNELEVDSNLSSSAIARKFGAQFKTKKHSRILLDRFIQHIA